MQSVLTRSLGKLESWPEVCGSQAGLGYNAIHFLPMQKYGSSNSMYSLKDQNSVDDWYVRDPRMTDDDRINLLEETVKTLRGKHDLLCFVDIVLNHTATNSDWLLDHPDAAYNLHNCPYLRVAYEFDVFLSRFSDDYAQGRVPECPKAPYVSTEEDLRAIVKAIAERIKTLPLDQYFVYDKKHIKKELEEFLAKGPYQDLNELKVARVNMVEYILKHSFGHGERQHGVNVSLPLIQSM